MSAAQSSRECFPTAEDANWRDAREILIVKKLHGGMRHRGREQHAMAPLLFLLQTELIETRKEFDTLMYRD